MGRGAAGMDKGSLKMFEATLADNQGMGPVSATLSLAPAQTWEHGAGARNQFETFDTVSAY